MPVVWSDACRRHDPGGEIWVGVRTPSTEVPERVDVILDALTEGGGARLVEADRQPDDALLGGLVRGTLLSVEEGGA